MFWKKAIKIRELERRLEAIEHDLCPNDTHDFYHTGSVIKTDDVVGGTPFEHEESYYKCKKCKKVIMRCRQIH
jgi:hypothetical protein